MTTDLLCVTLVQFHDEHPQRVVLVDALLQLTTDKRQLEIEVVGVAGFQVVQQRGDADLLVVLKVTIPINSEIDYRQKCVGIHMIHFACLADSLVAKAERDTKRA